MPDITWYCKSVQTGPNQLGLGAVEDFFVADAMGGGQQVFAGDEGGHARGLDLVRRVGNVADHPGHPGNGTVSLVTIDDLAYLEYVRE